MLRLAVATLSILTLVSCSHSQPKKTPHPIVSKSFLQMIKSSKPKTAKDKRLPASGKSVPGLNEFIRALKKHPQFFKVPVGHEVTTEYRGIDEDGPYEFTRTEVYLKDNKHGYFVLTLREGETDLSVDHYFTPEELEQIFLYNDDYSSIKKISPTTFLVSYETQISDEVTGLCQYELDLTKWQSLASGNCKDASGRIVEETNATLRAVNVSDYASYLKNTKLTVFSRALPCKSDDGGIDPECSSSATEDYESDWSYILK